MSIFVISNFDAAETQNKRIKNIPNSNVLGRFLIRLEKDAAIDNVVIVRIMANSFSLPVTKNERPIPIAKKPIAIRSASIILGKTHL